MPQSATLIADPSPAPLPGDISFTPSCHALLELLLAVSDGRSDQGRDHPVALVHALVAAATVAGSKGYSAISGWVADVPADILDGLYARVEARPAGRPSRSTLWRVCTDADVLDAVIAEWTTAQQARGAVLVEQPRQRRVTHLDQVELATLGGRVGHVDVREGQVDPGRAGDQAVYQRVEDERVVRAGGRQPGRAPQASR